MIIIIKTAVTYEICVHLYFIKLRLTLRFNFFFHSHLVKRYSKFKKNHLDTVPLFQRFLGYYSII